MRSLIGIVLGVTLVLCAVETYFIDKLYKQNRKVINQLETIKQEIRMNRQAINSNSQSINHIAKEVNQLRETTKKVQTQVNQLQKLLDDKVSVVYKFIKRVNPQIPDDIAKIEAMTFIRVSYQKKIPLHILLAVAYQESHFRSDAISPTGCVGVMQVNPRVWGLSRDVLLDPVFNIEAGAEILKIYYQQTGSWRRALMRYYGLDDFGIKIYPHSVLRKAQIVQAALAN